MKSFVKFFVVSVSLIASLQLKSQTCGTCSININTLDSANYSLNTGQTLCIDTAGNFIGTITLNGGSVCNKGLFNPKAITLTSGSVSNYGNCSFKASITLGSSTQLTNNSDAVININGTVTNSGGSLSNSGIINVDQNIQNNSGSITNDSVINCAAISGSGTLNNTGKINTN